MKAPPTIIPNPDGNRTLLVAAWEWGKVLGRLKVTFSDSGAVDSWEGNPVPVTADIAEDPTAKRMVETLTVPIANLRQQVIGQTTRGLNGNREVVRRRESTMANVLADAALAAAQNAGAQLAFVNGGGVRASINAGPITFDEAITVQPFGNTLTVLTLTGAQIRAALEHGVATWSENKGQFLHVSRGVSYTFDLGRPAGSRVTAVTLNGQALVDAQSYKVAMNNFTAGGGDGFTMFGGAPRLDTGTLDVDILVRYLQGRPAVDAEPEGRIVIINEPKP
ncbi:5'-nucleotidase, C-terminal domain [Deinococcus reticulitermitis]|uniref:5'-nucleotidase, C-terminal domain n=1 Tax=Deinococcus reticulitermitis TaxID=856736 RepID=A0A1H7C6W2_9DEIO|nr:5'-nucleotidase, C-terminal domain [Deinococcus reticulitermitis]